MIWLAHWGGKSLERRVGEHSATVGQRAGARLGHGGVAGLAVEVDGEGVETRGEVGQVGRRVGRGVVAVELGRPGVRGAGVVSGGGWRAAPKRLRGYFEIARPRVWAAAARAGDSSWRGSGVDTLAHMRVATLWWHLVRTVRLSPAGAAPLSGVAAVTAKPS